MNRPTKLIVVFLLTAIITAGSLLMVGPQILAIVPVAIVAGIVFAIRRTFFSLVCFGYPLSFGLISALIGCTEITGYERTLAFAVSMVIGLAGAGLIAGGLWKALPVRTTGEPSGVAEPEN